MRNPFALLLAALAAQPVWAHHSAAVYYKLDEQITLEGVVTRYNLTNPHTQIYLMVKGSAGTQKEWLAEGGSRTVLVRKGWTGEEVKPGERITVVGNPARDGSNAIHWRAVIRSDGEQIWGDESDSRPAAAEPTR
jgi:hypothetical protein